MDKRAELAPASDEQRRLAVVDEATNNITEIADRVYRGIAPAEQTYNTDRMSEIATRGMMTEEQLQEELNSGELADAA